MSALKISMLATGSKAPPACAPSVDAVARGLATFLFVAGVLIVLFAGTFPFDFSPPGPLGFWGQLNYLFNNNPNPNDYVDRAQNIVFFLPFGFALASVIHRPRNWKTRAAVRIGLALPLGAILSGIIEVSQAFVSFRDPSWSDIWANTVGSILGAAIFVACGDTLLRLAAQGLLHLRRFAKPAIVGGVLALYAIVQLSAPLLMRNAGDLSVWDTGLPLIVGNEATGDRGWRGAVSHVVMADRAATPDEVMQLARGGDPKVVFEDALIANYQLGGKHDSFPDLVGHLKPLEWTTGKPPDETPDGAAIVSGDNWLKTPVAIAWATHRVQTTSKFTLATTITTFDPIQRGPARIVAISAGPHGLNFILSQDDSDLVVRFRTATRSAPQLYLRNVLTDDTRHNIVVTHADAQVLVYVDGTERGRCEVTPEAKVIWRLYPRSGFRMYVEKFGFRTYAAIYRLLVFIPFAALLGATLALSRMSKRNKWIAGIVATIVMCVALEAILGTESASGFQIQNLVISLMIAFGTLGALALRAALRQRSGSLAPYPGRGLG